ncbi:hypothetical protein BS50DRAFT_211843 [Corynespora cassiicola Philippines]|uniref:Uncharacterized protein n=1 Tax=Corynespora cassiicola Philippines TaxID=1448308 RepID=A0A2T2N448_CORCC|nr:hypothetical protein BS50DRAFT_211843 [Corynespora cassiicola Philippines]
MTVQTENDRLPPAAGEDKHDVEGRMQDRQHGARGGTAGNVASKAKLSYPRDKLSLKAHLSNVARACSQFTLPSVVRWQRGGSVAARHVPGQSSSSTPRPYSLTSSAVPPPSLCTPQAVSGHSIRRQAVGPLSSHRADQKSLSLLSPPFPGARTTAVGRARASSNAMIKPDPGLYSVDALLRI